jgi:hypothetical protein
MSNRRILQKLKVSAFDDDPDVVWVHGSACPVVDSRLVRERFQVGATLVFYTNGDLEVR